MFFFDLFEKFLFEQLLDQCNSNTITDVLISTTFANAVK